MRIAVIFAVAATLLSACGHHLDRGIIIGKQYTAPYVYILMICASYDKYGICQVSIPDPISEPAEWALNLQDGNKAGSTDVDQVTYDQVKLGQQYP